MLERISARDGSLIPGYAIHIQRYNHALPHCLGKRVLDAGCGVGYGSNHLARRGAAQVTGVDISSVAIGEARERYRLPNLSYLEADLQNLDGAAGLPASFDVIVNLENIEHLPKPEQFLAGARKRLEQSTGTLIVSTPNANMGVRNDDGTKYNDFHEKEYTADELRALLGKFFPSIEMSGQWKTPDGMLRDRSARNAFKYQCEAYYNPGSRLRRALKKLAGRAVDPPPTFIESGDSYTADHMVAPLSDPPFDWQCEYLLAVCRFA